MTMRVLRGDQKRRRPTPSPTLVNSSVCFTRLVKFHVTRCKNSYVALASRLVILKNAAGASKRTRCSFLPHPSNWRGDGRVHRARAWRETSTRRCFSWADALRVAISAWWTHWTAPTSPLIRLHRNSWIGLLAMEARKKSSSPPSVLRRSIVTGLGKIKPRRKNRLGCLTWKVEHEE